jgi:AbrB family looped-hinge helix DNA binding protein
MRTTLSTKGQVVLPKPLREQAGWEPGTALEAHLNSTGEIVLRKLEGTQLQRLQALFAGGKPGREMLDELLEDHRREVEEDEREYLQQRQRDEDRGIHHTNPPELRHHL